MTQQEAPELAHVSRPWLIKLERGHPNAELGKVLAVVRSLQQVVNLADRP